MSKLQLKKELNSMSKDQLAELVLDLYSARKEIKEYLEFFLNPNVEKLVEKFRKNVDKELRRSKHGYSKARVSGLKRMVNDVSSFSPGADTVIDCHLYLVKELIHLERYLNLPGALYNGFNYFVEQSILLAYADGYLDKTIAQLNDLANNDKIGRQYFRTHLKNLIQATIDSLKSSLS